MFFSLRKHQSLDHDMEGLNKTKEIHQRRDEKEQWKLVLLFRE